MINTLVRIKLELCSFCQPVHRTETTDTERSKPAGANAISDISAPAPTERKKLAANFNTECRASFTISYCVSVFDFCSVLFCCLIATPLILTPNDLSVLSRHLHSVSPKWYALGLQLGVSTEMLAKLVPVNCDPAFHLNQVLSTWLHHANPPTLDALCTALSHATVGAETLAEWLLRRKFNPTYRYLLAYTW